MILNNRSKTVLSFILVLVVILTLILAAEGIVRVRQYIKYGTFHGVTDLHFDKHSGLYTPLPSMKTASISINSMGFRGPEIEMPKPDNRLRIGFIGASTTYCAEVSNNDMVWSDITSHRLKSSIPGLSVDYINAGVPGYTTDTSLINLEKRVVPLQPDIVIIYHATNDLSSETRALAEAAGIERTNLAAEESWLGRYSLLWHLVQKNVTLLMLQAPSETELLKVDPQSIGDEFRQNLEKLVYVAYKNGANLVALMTFSIHLRDGMTIEQQEDAMISARYYMPYLSADDLLAGFKQYNQIIREVAEKTGALLIEREHDIPGDPIHFNDSVHFTDKGSQKQAERVVTALVNSSKFQEIVSAKKNEL
ncbi:SGNH/GDSL hydrolase family protein [Nitrosomonas aestuarii]|uniref:SGNH/GDSL hydrolase family protein n=1 Tax=Nitrosomonas aestuarii TaxID=52441 RepID=UPI000D2FE7DA|nr:SGNH/GDSL hydrolase family protein [Nitrosomonas aestuarii]PTN11172.1 lysophospholipase L1-like esterase [Nitrosomonas aestuarii]